MRVISGNRKGSVLICQSGTDTRPTSDRAKESLFNILPYDLSGVTFLDLYAGSGAIGIEALSRGAGLCVFVESGSGALSAINSNIKKTRLLDKSRVMKMDVSKALNVLAKEKLYFDYVFLDPPYLGVEVEKTLSMLSKLDIINDQTAIIAEVDSNYPEDTGFPFALNSVRKHGNSKFLFFGGIE